MALYVQDINDELHASPTLNDLLQRSLTENYKDIASYILEHTDDRFFNALVLATYDGDPQWIEVELNFEEEEFFTVGFLRLTGSEKIFPIDGQHRVKGIKEALHQSSDVAAEQIPVVLVAHKRDVEGMQRSRRLFSTLNRYAKPVSEKDIISLDEDDTAALLTRHLVDHSDLFTGNKTISSSSKRIPASNKQAFTSIITLYRCNLELIGHFASKRGQMLKKFLRTRPKESQLSELIEQGEMFWDTFRLRLAEARTFSGDPSSDAASRFRHESGGNLLFRPVALVPFVRAAITLKERTGESFDLVLSRLDQVPLEISQIPWRNVLWNVQAKTMIMAKPELIQNILLYMAGRNVLSTDALNKLRTDYAASIYYEGDPMQAFAQIPTIE